jgi:hypothetical protein
MGAVMRLHTIEQEASSMAREQTGDELGVENSAGSGPIVLKTAGVQLSVHFYIILPATLKRCKKMPQNLFAPFFHLDGRQESPTLPLDHAELCAQMIRENAGGNDTDQILPGMI